MSAEEKAEEVIVEGEQAAEEMEAEGEEKVEEGSEEVLPKKNGSSG